MILQLHELKEPVPKDMRPGDIVQWATWYTRHLLNGGRKIEEIPSFGTYKSKLIGRI